MKDFKDNYSLACTFTLFGTKDKINTVAPKGATDIVFEVDEFEGTDEEFHSGSFQILLILENKKRSRQIEKFIHENGLIGEFFCLTNLRTKIKYQEYKFSWF